MENKICELYKEGHSSLKIAKMLNCSKKKVLNVLHRNNINIRKGRESYAHRLLGIEKMQSIAKSKEGHCLSKKYVNAYTKLKWKCKHGHIWDASPNNIKNNKTWCPHCENHEKNKKYYQEDAEQYAKERNGKCLGKFVSANVHSQWQCEKGHSWSARLSDMLQKGGWCSKCYCKSRRLGIEVAQNLAAKNFGQCLSKEYVSIDKKLIWKCEEGHKWEATLNNVKNKNSWCPHCSSSYREEKFREILELTTGIKFARVRPLWLLNENGNRLEIDGYNDDLKLGFEYQGIQHFEYIKHLHKNKKRFIAQKKRDEIKKKTFEQKGIKIMYPDRFTKIEDYQNFIVNFLYDNNLERVIKNE